MSTTSIDDVGTTFVPAMRRAIELAARGPARGVNPQVGCVILGEDGAVLAEGWHRGAGTAHAEVDALSKLGPGGARGTTAVVTLEPCNHTGRTGPCSEALIAAGVARVVYAVADPTAHAAGGAQRLAQAGVDVLGGVLADEVESFLGSWLAAARLRRPVVTVKWASSLDGRAAAADGTSQWITGPEARADVHRRRAESDAIAVGTGTVIADDPALSARHPDGSLMDSQPIPVVFGRSATPADAALRQGPNEPVFLTGADLAADLAQLHSRGIRSLFVEGGPRLVSSLLAERLVDQVLVYLAPALIGGPKTAIGDIGVDTIGDAMRLELTGVDRLGEDIVLLARPKN
ncbi:bifunctional diaminohydroxyphosphoribosylaminopyrimidine deaminase/5-amino-6-(5-phosphoribosylamino)uracil reductase RibD [Rathayibacter sp. YIM 133350]|uniref:bifunctional diaminohydroxyphosphoribosylaminopyrimidine deaminase/5-amino-6-(5-phosphoribosylamino)uracil reductase RibD n=1 Tax=Rathayibacter sp. YIM 133350 TaxID=3131992 RepID=UPI00307D710D